VIDHKPSIVIRCAGASDVIQAIKFSAKLQLLTALRGGGYYRGEGLLRSRFDDRS